MFFNCNDLSIFDKANAGVLLTDITDHCYISISILDKVKIIEKQINFVNYDLLKSILSKVNWTNLYESDSVNECCTIFQTIISNALNEATSLKSINAKNKRLKDWMSKGLLCSAHRKQSHIFEMQKTSR